MLDELVLAARAYDRPRTVEAVNVLTRHVLGTGERLEERPLRDALVELRNNRWFDLLQSAGDALIQSGDTRAPVRKLYAQSLIDGGVISAAIPFLERLVAESTGYERDEARGLLGRAWKQVYVSDMNLARPLAKSLLERSVEQYYTPYVEDDENLWHGINTVAMLARGQRDGITLAGPDPQQLAATIRDAVKARDDSGRADVWDYATAAEACVALGDCPGALGWLKLYVADREITAFAAAGTLRQFTEVWQLSGRGEGDGGPLVHLLQAEVLARSGGQSLDVSHARAELQAIDSEAEMLEAVLGDEKYKTLEWYRTGLMRASGVARIGFEATRGQGTGVLVELGGEQFLVTNHHVIPTRITEIERAVVTFESLDRKKYRVKELLWTSPIPQLDATILRLDKEVKGVEPPPLCAELPDIADKPRVYVIGHPMGGTMSFSISDNALIDHRAPKVHYRAPTDPGSSGSPVFDATWALLALHHAGDENMPRLHGDGAYPANEGLFMNAIVEEFEKARVIRRPAKRKRQP